ncbi:hypothetical protein BDZ45DRAFT_719241 [Acephala macrosclerotiorum]|nr:hypothetical protein BDZ45DRAFT_719241 [Acephala macrosclerotiorum]
MELSLAVVDAIWRPSYVFKHERLKRFSASSTPEWHTSPLNPKNRVDSLDSSNSRWRIDGATACGTQFFAIPLQLMPDLVPIRVDVYLPDQSEYPVALYRTLDASWAVPLRHPESIANLGISRHLCRALDSYSAREPRFLDQYQQLAFGSRLVFDNVAADVEEMRASVVPAHDLERRSRSLKSLQELWAQDIPQDRWPLALDLSELRFVRQLHDTVSVVTLVNDDPASLFIFKSSTQNFEHLYHELRFLLTTPPHPNVMSRPLHVITKKCLFGAKKGVFGFILPYYRQGSIRDILPRLVQNGTLSLSQKLRWCREITSALIHINEQAGTFFSDLRPDNVLLSGLPSSSDSDSAMGRYQTHDSSASVLLCDFEQRGNWHEWCSPEVLYRQYIENLRSNRVNPLGDRWFDLVETYSDNDTSIEDFVQMRNRAWFSLSPQSREKAQVYSLGLFIYCVFEGLSNVRKSLANAYIIDSDLQFPEMRRTPPRIHELIRHCTIDAPEWQDSSGKIPSMNPNPSRSTSRRLPPRAKRVIRLGDKLYPEGCVDLDANGPEVASAVCETAMQWWTVELERARQFAKSEEWQSESFGKDRPTLREVFDQLECFEKSETV